MKKIEKHIEIVRTRCLGYTTVGTNSCNTMGLSSCNRIAKVLSEHYQQVGVTLINSLSDLDMLAQKRPDLVFMGVKKLPLSRGQLELSDDVWVSEFLEQAGINHTGSPKSAIELEKDKASAKLQVGQAGLPTAPFFTAFPGQFTDPGALPLEFPLFVKPLNDGGGKGIDDDSVVRNFQEFKQKVDAIFDEFEKSSLVEEYLIGREFSVALMGFGYDSELQTMPIELITECNFQGDRVLGRRVKKADTEQVIAVHDPIIRNQVNQLAKQVFKALGARDYGRVDIRMDANGQPHFLEANLAPGLGGGYFTRACKINEGLSHESTILKLAELALARAVSTEEMVVV